MIINEIAAIIKKVFDISDYKLETIKIVKSNRPDLCDFQCDDVFKIAKQYKTNPIMVGEKIVEEINNIENFEDYFSEVSFAKPGFINIKLSNKFINKNLRAMTDDIKTHFNKPNKKETFVVDFGGANVAKPLHVGHMRTIMVGESIARTIRFMGHETVTDVHLGDYGLQIGQVIYGIKRDNKTIDEIDIKYLEKIYPEMSGICKENEEIKAECAEITKQLQDGNEEYVSLWQKILKVSIADIKVNYDFLGANFDFWYGESDAYPYLDKVDALLREENLLKESRGADIVEVNTNEDKSFIPPLLFKKSNGAYLYASTDLGTLQQRKEDFNPDHVLYVVDNRQAMHFEQVFRTAALSKMYEKNQLEHLGYGTVNGEDGKPFKTRSGDNPKLEGLFKQAAELFISKKESNKEMSSEDVNKIVNAILKFADLQNCREKDYIFDLNKFSDVSGKTGPYILYTYLRINKILKDENFSLNLSDNIENEFDRDLRLKLLEFANSVEIAFNERMPHYIADYVYNLSVASNIFYQNNRINGLENEDLKNDWLYVLALTNKVIKELLDLLVISIPSAM